MKIQILTDVSDCIDGYNPVFIEDNTINLDVPKNSIDSILMINSIEKISHNYIDNFINKVRELLRINGKIVITGVDIGCLCRDFINGVVDSSVMNEVVYSRNGIYDCKELSDKLNALNIKTDKLLLKGSSYELHAVRNN